MAKVLLMEDDRELGPLIVHALQDVGHSVTWVNNMEDALHFFDEEDIDIVVTDMLIKLGASYARKGGASLIWEIRERTKGFGKFVPIIAITSGIANLGTHQTVSAARLAGANQVIEKPFKPDDLTQAIAKRLEMRSGSS